MSGVSGWIEWIIFGALALVAVVTAASMIVTMSMYRAGLALMSSFIALAGIFVLLNADMLAAIQIMMNVGGMLIMILFMVMLMMDPGGEMMWEMKRSMRMRGLGALSMHPPKGPPPAEDTPTPHKSHATHTMEPPEPSAPTIYTCPMHPEVRQPTPGACPKCGMTLVPVDEQSAPVDTSTAPRPHAAPATHEEAPTALAPMVYTCPMHPEVRQSSPGQCPKCGMTLVPATDTAPSTTDHDHTVTSSHTEHAERAEHAEHGAHADAGMSGADKGGMDGEARRSGHDGHRGLTPRQNYQMLLDMAMSTAQAPLALGLGALAAALLVAVVILTPWTVSPRVPTGDASAPVGVLLLSRYMVGFEGAAFLILAGIAAAVMFARREPPPVAPSTLASSQSQRATDMEGTSHARHTSGRESNPVVASAPQMDEPHEMDTMDTMDHMKQMDQEDTIMSDETTTPTGETIYTCPMHPEVRQNAPGNCPICGMFLVPVAEPAPDQPQSDAHEGHGSHDA